MNRQTPSEAIVPRRVAHILLDTGTGILPRSLLSQTLLSNAHAKAFSVYSVMIDPSSDLQVHHWATDMQIEPYELRAAVALVGPVSVTPGAILGSPRLSSV